MADEITDSNCRKCSRATKHTVLFETSHDAEHEHFNEKHLWQVLRCRGCETVGFRYRFDDYDDITELPDGETKHATTYYRYPQSIPGHRELAPLYVVPTLIRRIYLQSVTAFAGDAKILAGIGLRATIEAVCNHLKVSGASLEKRIDALAKSGHISTNDKRRLHAIRFLGNDAAHDIRQPKVSDLRVALDIVEHLITTVFILEHKSRNLDVQVETYEQFKALLEHCIVSIKSENPQSLAAILGPQKRRISGELASFEALLRAEIDSGAVEYLKPESVQQVEGKDVQLYRVDTTKFIEDIPF